MTSSTPRRLTGSLALSAVLAASLAGTAQAAQTCTHRGGPDAGHATHRAAPARPHSQSGAHTGTVSRGTSSSAAIASGASAVSSTATSRSSTNRSSTVGTSTLALASTTSTSTAGLSANAVLVLRAINQDFPQVTDIGGLRQGSDAQDHATGHALDLMTTDRATGDEIAAFLQAHAAELGVKYVIWRQHIWSVQRSSEGWRAMADRGSTTANHYDHVHVSVD